MSLTLGQSWVEKKESIIKVLTMGSSISPISLDELKYHFAKTDPTGWNIIKNSLMHATDTEILEILKGVARVEGIRYSVMDLIDMLISLEEDSHEWPFSHIN